MIGQPCRLGAWRVNNWPWPDNCMLFAKKDIWQTKRHLQLTVMDVLPGIPGYIPPWCGQFLTAWQFAPPSEHGGANDEALSLDSELASNRTSPQSYCIPIICNTLTHPPCLDQPSNSICAKQMPHVKVQAAAGPCTTQAHVIHSNVVVPVISTLMTTELSPDRYPPDRRGIVLLRRAVSGDMQPSDNPTCPQCTQLCHAVMARPQ